MCNYFVDAAGEKNVHKDLKSEYTMRDTFKINIAVISKQSHM